MKKIFGIIGIFFSVIANADVIKCNFTEPYFTTTYSMAQQRLTVIDASGAAKIISPVSFQIIDAGKFELRNKKGDVLQTLNLTYKGSSGIGGDLYPFEVVSSAKVHELGANNGVGGCSSNFLKKVEGQY